VSRFAPKPKVPPTGVIDVDVLGAHAWSIDHRPELLSSARCGCFHCLATYSAEAIEDWVDIVDGVGVTALCPSCGIDSVIGSASGYPIEAWFLARMRAHWFDGG
jgi:hypothetical protein